MLNYRITNDGGRTMGYIEINGEEFPFIPLESFDKRATYGSGLYIADRAWTKKASSIIDDVKKTVRKNYDNVVVVNFAKEKDVNTTSQVIEFINKQRKKDFSDPDVVRSMSINREKDSSSVIMAKYEKCYVFLDRLERMDGFEPKLLKDLANWNCAVFLEGMPG